MTKGWNFFLSTKKQSTNFALHTSGSSSIRTGCRNFFNGSFLVASCRDHLVFHMTFIPSAGTFLFSVFRTGGSLCLNPLTIIMTECRNFFLSVKHFFAEFTMCSSCFSRGCTIGCYFCRFFWFMNKFK